MNEDWNSGRLPPPNATETELNNYVLFRTIGYQTGGQVDDELHEWFAEDFTTWSQQTFDKANNDLIRGLRSILRHRGVYVASDRRKVALNLTLAVNGHNQWPLDEIEKQMTKAGGFHESSIHVRRHPHPEVQGQPRPLATSSAQPPTAPFETPHDTLSIEPSSVSDTKPSITPFASNTKPPVTPFATTSTAKPSAAFPPPPAPSADVDNSSRLISDLMRGYRDQDKYSGEKHEFLVRKVELFTNHCEMIGLKPDKRLKALPILFAGRAHEFYYAQGFATSKKSEAEILTAILNHFETENVRQDYVNEWHGVTMQAMISEHPTKSKLECFDIMTARLRRIAPGLPSMGRKTIDATMRDQVLRGCRGIPECSLAVYQPNASYEGLCADIKNAIAVKALETAHRQQFTTEHNEDDDDDAFWTDRTFGRSRPPPDRGRRQRGFRGRGSGKGRGYSNERHDADRTNVPADHDDVPANDNTDEEGVRPDETRPSQLPDDEFTPQPPPPKRRPGRPKGSKNKPKPSTAFISPKETSDRKLSEKLRREGKITTPGRPFEASDKAEVDALIANEIFRFEAFNPNVHHGRIFKSRLVREIKDKTTNHPYEKSRLVIQGFGDDEKSLLLTQAPTIQRASQRLILALAPSLFELSSNATTGIISLYLRDITMAYTQSTTALNRTILARPPDEVKPFYPPETIMVVVKPLYGIAEAGTHWWATYTSHHKTKLGMTASTYDPCLLITTKESKGFGVVGIQTDDTLILADENFAADEERRLTFKSKPRKEVTDGTEIGFNGCKIRRDGNTIEVTAKGQGERLATVSTAEDDSTEHGSTASTAATRQGYIKQRARGAYIASLCQPEAAFDLSTAAQTTEPTQDDIKALNRRLEWQMTNQARGLIYVPVDLDSAALYIFVDASFANNRDLSFQIGYIIVLGNETSRSGNVIKLRGNIIHWSSTKCRRVTRSVLASEILAMTNGVDIGYALGETMDQIMGQLQQPPVAIVVCTDSFSLYECVVKLGTTKEKRLMIDVMAMRQMYERRELVEIRWISGPSNPADSMTKTAPNAALASLVTTNEIELGIEGWVDR